VVRLRSQKSQLREIFVGITQDFARRMHEHNKGKSKFTSGHIPWDCIYHELVETTRQARVREKYLKSAAGKRFLAKRLADAGSLPD
jgi:putative endonuclease